MNKLRSGLKSQLDDGLFAVMIVCASVAAAAMEVTAMGGAFGSRPLRGPLPGASAPLPFQAAASQAAGPGFLIVTNVP